MKAETKQVQITELLEELIGALQFSTKKLQEIALQKPNEWSKQELEKNLSIVSAILSTALIELGKLMYLLLGE